MLSICLLLRRSSWSIKARAQQPLRFNGRSQQGLHELVHESSGRLKDYNFVIVGSPNVNPGYKLVSNTRYPQIAEDYEKGFRVLNSLPGDIFLGAHGSYFDLETNYEQFKRGVTTAFVDPDGYKTFVADREQAFFRELRKQRGTSN